MLSCPNNPGRAQLLSEDPTFRPLVGSEPVAADAQVRVLLLNLGTPSAPDRASVRRYLAEFLGDPRVVELPRWLWLPLLNGVILPLRAGRSAHAYRSIWTGRGSPLLVNSLDLAAAVQRELGACATVACAMRYGQPDIASTLAELVPEGSDPGYLLVLPLYPQYSATTTATALDAVAAVLRRRRWQPALRWITSYADEPAWQRAVADSIRTHWQQHGRGERLLFSFHGLPQAFVDAGDPYLAQCRRSADGVVRELALDPSQWQLCFQSRVGKAPWLRPYTDEVIAGLADAGIRRIDVVAPGFSVDCLETLEEIAIRYDELFREHGGERLSYVPALNAHDSHARTLADLIRRQCAGWPDFGSGAHQA